MVWLNLNPIRLNRTAIPNASKRILMRCDPLPCGLSIGAHLRSSSSQKPKEYHNYTMSQANIFSIQPLRSCGAFPAIRIHKNPSNFAVALCHSRQKHKIWYVERKKNIVLHKLCAMDVSLFSRARQPTANASAFFARSASVFDSHWLTHIWNPSDAIFIAIGWLRSPHIQMRARLSYLLFNVAHSEAPELWMVN